MAPLLFVIKNVCRDLSFSPLFLAVPEELMPTSIQVTQLHYTTATSLGAGVGWQRLSEILQLHRKVAFKKCEGVD